MEQAQTYGDLPRQPVVLKSKHPTVLEHLMQPLAQLGHRHLARLLSWEWAQGAVQFNTGTCLAPSNTALDVALQDMEETQQLRHMKGGEDSSILNSASGSVTSLVCLYHKVGRAVCSRDLTGVAHSLPTHKKKAETFSYSHLELPLTSLEDNGSRPLSLCDTTCFRHRGSKK